MAKRKTTRKRSTGATRTVYVKPKRKSYRRKRGLSQGFSRTAVKNSAENALIGALTGAAMALVVDNIQFIKDMNNTNRALVMAGVGIVGAVLTKQPAVAAGAGSVAIRPLLQGLNILADNGPGYLPPISDDSQMAMLPSGLAQGPDYAGLSQGPNIYASSYANRFNY